MWDDDERLNEELDAEQERLHDKRVAKLVRSPSFVRSQQITMDTSDAAVSARKWLDRLRLADSALYCGACGKLSNHLLEGRVRRNSVNYVFQRRSMRTSLRLINRGGALVRFAGEYKPDFSLWRQTAARCKLRMAAAQLGTTADGDPSLFKAVPAIEEAHAAVRAVSRRAIASANGESEFEARTAIEIPPKLEEWICSDLSSDEPTECERDIEIIRQFNEGMWAAREKWLAICGDGFIRRVSDEVVFAFGGRDFHGVTLAPTCWDGPEEASADFGKPLTHQALALVKLLGSKKHPVSFDTLAADRSIFRREGPLDDSIITAFKRTNRQMLDLEMTATIEWDSESRRAVLVDLAPDK